MSESLTIKQQRNAVYDESDPEGYEILHFHECYMNSHSQLVMWCIMRRLADNKLVAFQYESNSEESMFDYGEVFEVGAVQVPSMMFVPVGVSSDDEDLERVQRQIKDMGCVVKLFDALPK